MGVYSRIRVTEATEYALVNKGTSPTKLNNWLNNIAQPIGLSTDMKDSIKQSTKFVNAHKGNEITMVGHFKRGG